MGNMYDIIKIKSYMNISLNALIEHNEKNKFLQRYLKVGFHKHRIDNWNKETGAKL